MAKNTNKFTNFKCNKKDSIDPKFDEYVFSFKYKGNEVKYYMFTSKAKHVSKDDAQKEFNKLKQNGQLEKYAKRFDKDEKRKKKLIPIFCFLAAGAVAGAAYGTYYAINNGGNKPIEEKVEISEELVNEGVALSNPTVKIGEKYETKITVDTTKSGGKVLPDKLEKVTCGNKDLDPLPPKNEYTYTLDADGKKADLVIPAEFVTGNITIKFSLVTPVPPGPTEYEVFIPSIKGLLISDDKAYSNQNYAPTITFDNKVDPSKELPSTIAVTVGTTPLDEKKGEFTYTLNEGHLTADLFIGKDFIKDTITITFELADAKKTVEFNGAGCEAFIGKDTFEEGEFNYGSKVDLTLKQKSIYSKPDTISFTTKSGEEYKGEASYNKDTGAISIASLTEDVVITAEAPALEYSTMHYEYSSNEGENVVSIGFTKAASAENVSVDWGNGAPVTYTESPAVSKELTTSADIKIYGAASIALYKGTQVLSEGNKRINSVTFSNSITTIDDSAFYGIPLTGELYLPENITTVKGYSFVNTQISSIHISSKCNISSQKSPFYCNTQLERISVSPENKSYYSENECLMKYNDNQPILFQGTKNSTIPNNTYKIADEAFHWIDVPEELVIPASVTEIGNSAFSAYFAGTTRQSKLKKVTFEDNSQLKSIGSSSMGSSFSSNENLEAVLNVPNTLEKICDTSFSSCLKLSRFNGTEGVCDFPDSVKTISYRAFSNCDGFKVVIMPASLTDMGGGGQFISTYLTTVDLTKLTNPDAIPPITRTEGPFGNPTTIITASDEMTAAFQSAKGWGDHASKYYTQTGLEFNSKTYHLLYPSPAGLGAPYYINNIVNDQGEHPAQSAITATCGGEECKFSYKQETGEIRVEKITGPLVITIKE